MNSKEDIYYSHSIQTPCDSTTMATLINENNDSVQPKNEFQSNQRFTIILFFWKQMRNVLYSQINITELSTK